MDLIEFLEARLAEDEQRATAALGLLGYANEWWTVDELRKFPRGDGHAFTLADAGFVAAHTPKRVLREVAAKRAIIEAADEASSLDSTVDTDRRVGVRDLDTEPLIGDVILRELAAVYSDHPDYRPEWTIDA